MKNKSLVFLMVFALSAMVSVNAWAQEEGYKFTIDKELPRTSIKSQINGTCWCYSTV
ncbi:MAG: aminopeptidase, partial [Planctomycetes bacterium]|nr:aminopeptidase [Planctomycetota bacterium]